MLHSGCSCSTIPLCCNECFVQKTTGIGLATMAEGGILDNFQDVPCSKWELPVTWAKITHRGGAGGNHSPWDCSQNCFCSMNRSRTKEYVPRCYGDILYHLWARLLPQSLAVQSILPFFFVQHWLAGGCINPRKPQMYLFFSRIVTPRPSSEGSAAFLHMGSKFNFLLLPRSTELNTGLLSNPTSLAAKWASGTLEARLELASLRAQDPLRIHPPLPPLL